MDEVEKWTRHFRLMAAGKLRKESGGYYIVNQEPDDQTGGIESPLDPSLLWTTYRNVINTRLEPYSGTSSEISKTYCHGIRRGN